MMLSLERDWSGEFLVETQQSRCYAKVLQSMGVMVVVKNWGLSNILFIQ